MLPAESSYRNLDNLFALKVVVKVQRATNRVSIDLQNDIMLPGWQGDFTFPSRHVINPRYPKVEYLICRQEPVQQLESVQISDVDSQCRRLVRPRGKWPQRRGTAGEQQCEYGEYDMFHLANVRNEPRRQPARLVRQHEA